jgi:hypothetical protein
MTCKTCGGSGRIYHQHPMKPVGVISHSTPCPDCTAPVCHACNNGSLQTIRVISNNKYRCQCCGHVDSINRDPTPTVQDHIANAGKMIVISSCADCPFCDRLYGPLADKHYAMCNAMNTPSEAFCVGHNVENKTRPERCPLPVTVEVEK